MSLLLIGPFHYVNKQKHEHNLLQPKLFAVYASWLSAMHHALYY